MDTKRVDWYVRHDGSYLSVESENDAVNLPQFQLDSSFIMHSDTFYPYHYALESLSFPYWYIKLLSDGRLGIVQRDSATEYDDTASFRVYDYHKSSAYSFSVSSSAVHICEELSETVFCALPIC